MCVELNMKRSDVKHFVYSLSFIQAVELFCANIYINKQQIVPNSASKMILTFLQFWFNKKKIPTFDL